MAAFVGTAVVLTTLDMIPASFAAAWWLLVLLVARNDLADFLIPDEASLAIALLGLAQVATLSLVAGQSVVECLTSLAAALVRGSAAAAFLWAIGRTFRLVSGREGLGFGDVKLMGASCIWLAPMQQAIALELAVLAALAVIFVARRSDARDSGVILPFGAFLAPAAWLAHVADRLSPGLFEAGS